MSESEQTISVKPTLIAAGCTVGEFAFDYGNHCVAFASSRNVCLLKLGDDDNPGAIVSSNSLHTQDVVCVRWMRNGCAATDHLLSCSSDGHLVHSILNGDILEVRHTIHFKTGYIRHVSGVRDDAVSRSYVLCCGTDGVVSCWRDFKMLQNVCCDESMAVCCDIAMLDDGLMACIANVDNCIRLYFLPHLAEAFDFLLQLEKCKDSIFCVQFSVVADNGLFYLAVGFQSHCVKIWKFTKETMLRNDLSGFDLSRSKSFRTDQNGCNWSVVVDTVLRGHSQEISGLTWNSEVRWQLASCSFDRSIILWTYNENKDVWEDETTLGYFGGSETGLYGVAFSADGSEIVTCDYEGCLNAWRRRGSEWKPIFVPTGHTRSVEDIAWDPTGRFLMSCSLDMTTRLFGEWISADRKKKVYSEVSRPQVHGFEMRCCAFINSYAIVSGGAEKVLRIFTAPKTFRNMFAGAPDDAVAEVSSENIVSASLGALGLSNRPMFETDSQVEQISRPDEPPDSAYLAKETLWPEVKKLFGHGFEIYAVACSHSGKVVASACKASTEQHANVLLWSVDDCVPVSELRGHRLTVTAIAFSCNDRFILTVSRDRSWCIFKNSGTNDFDYAALQLLNADNVDKHSRLIWDCAWMGHECEKFITVGRDQKAIVWQLDISCNKKLSAAVAVVKTSTLRADSSITTVDVCKEVINDGTFLCAFGFESGQVGLYLWCSEKEFRQIFRFDQSRAHSLSVKRVQFNPISELNLQLSRLKCKVAFCSEDCGLKVYEVVIRC